MKKLALTILLIVLSGALRAAEVQVEVVSAGAPMGYAYVYINGRIYGSADAGGRTWIPEKMLHPGDSISASFVGTGPGSAIYNPGAGRMTLELRRMDELETLVVPMKIDAEKFFRRFVNRRQPGEWMDAFTGIFQMDNPDEYTINGRFHRAYLPSDYISATGQSTMDIWALGQKKDKEYRSEAYYYIPYVFGSVINAGGLNKKIWYNKDMAVKYLGRDSTRLRFSLSRPMGALSTESFQTLVTVDPATKEVVSAQGTVRTGSMKLDFEADYAIVPKADLIYPSHISGQITVENSHRWDIVMDSIVYDERHKQALAGLQKNKKYTRYKEKINNEKID